MPLAKMFLPESKPIPIRSGYGLITGSWTRSFTELSRKGYANRVTTNRPQSRGEQSNHKESARKGCVRPKHACANPN